MPITTLLKLTGGGSQAIGGVIYVPHGAVQWAGNSAATQQCTKIIADTITLVGDSSLQVNCQGMGTKPINSPALMLE